MIEGLDFSQAASQPVDRAGCAAARAIAPAGERAWGRIKLAGDVGQPTCAGLGAQPRCAAPSGTGR
jgi:hypothetical protein